MRYRIFAIVLGSVTLLALLPVPAGAGGWWSYAPLDRQHVAAGDTVVARTVTGFVTTDDAERASAAGEYSAYLVRGIDRQLLDRAMTRPNPRRWWAQPRAAYRIGPVTLSERASGLITVKVTGSVPSVAPGRYAVMLCDAGCRHPLGDFIPTEGIRVHATQAAADAAHAMATMRQVRTEARMNRQVLADEMDVVRTEARRATRAGERANNKVIELQAQIDALTTRIAAESAPPQRDYSGWIVAAVIALAWALQRLRRRPAPVHDTAGPTGTASDRDVELVSR